MWAILKLISSRGYWRNLAQWDTWRLGWIALRRAHKDKRARKRLRVFLLMVLAPLLAPLCVLLIFTPGGLIGSAIYAFRTNRQKRKNRENDALRLVERPPPPPATAVLRKEVAEIALLHAVLADRAGSEGFVQTKILPEGIEVITRRVQLNILRERNLYERLGDIERDLLLLPDGHWGRGAIDEVALGLETLRLLRWVLRVDHFLPSVGESLVLNYKLAADSVADPESLFRGEEFITFETLDNSLRNARNYMNRCFAEEVKRELRVPKTEETAAWCKRVVEEYADDENKDYALGSTIVSRAEDFWVLRGRLFAARRYRVLQWIAKRMYGDVPPNERLEAFFLRPDPKTEIGDGAKGE